LYWAFNWKKQKYVHSEGGVEGVPTRKGTRPRRGLRLCTDRRRRGKGDGQEDQGSRNKPDPPGGRKEKYFCMSHDRKKTRSVRKKPDSYMDQS